MSFFIPLFLVTFIIFIPIFLKCAQVHRDILETYQDDFSKYGSRISPILLANTLKSIAQQAGGKFVYSRVEGSSNSAVVKEALSLLVLAGLAIPVVHTSANGVPLGADIIQNIKSISSLMLV